MIPLPNPCPQCQRGYTNPIHSQNSGYFHCPNCRAPLAKADEPGALSVDFSMALQLVSLGYRMRYEDWPADDYLEADYCKPRRRFTLCRFYGSVDEQPYERLPYITSNMCHGKWYFAKRNKGDC